MNDIGSAGVVIYDKSIAVVEGADGKHVLPQTRKDDGLIIFVDREGNDGWPYPAGSAAVTGRFRLPDGIFTLYIFEDGGFAEKIKGSIGIFFDKVDDIVISDHGHAIKHAIRDFFKMRYVLSELKRFYPGAVCSLEHVDPLELMVSVQLSAQCTDKRVNTVTEKLFGKYRTVDDYADADLKTFENEIRSTGLYRNKARNIINMAKKVRSGYGGRFPDDLDELLKLDGVGRKTGNLFLSEVYGIPGIVVDTHVVRISGRLGFTDTGDPRIIEEQLCSITEKKEWTGLGHLYISFGRDICNARKPECSRCTFTGICRYYKDKMKAPVI